VGITSLSPSLIISGVDMGVRDELTKEEYVVLLVSWGIGGVLVVAGAVLLWSL
jgi:hypothetical protein